jgi:hypothetical protein
MAASTSYWPPPRWTWSPSPTCASRPAFRKRKRTITEVRITGEIAPGDFGRTATDTTGGTFAATGKPLDIMGVHEAGEEDLVVAERHYWGLLELLTQLELFSPVPES